MAEELQSLLDRIYSEGVNKAEAERKNIIDKARSEAAAIVAEAKSAAEKIVAEAGAEAEKLQQRAESAVRQAARDILLKLKTELESRIDSAVKDAAAGAMTPEIMAGIIKDLAAKFADDPSADITVLCAVKDEESLKSLLCGTLRESFVREPKVFADSSISGGMEVNFKDGEFYFDFTVPALAELVGKYTTERIANLLKD